MFTPARIFLAIGVAVQAFPQLADAAKLAWWISPACACLGIFCQVITATTGPVQYNSKDNETAKAVVAMAKNYKQES
jgi:hypothetical protein